MYIYVVLVVFQLFWVFIMKCNKLRGKWLVSVVPFLTMFFLAAFRSENVGNDSSYYLHLFEQIQQGADIAYWSDRFEWGYLIFNKFIAVCFSNKYAIFIASSIVIYSIIGIVIKNESYSKWMSVFLFLTIGLYSNSVNVIRLTMAYSICLLAYQKLSQNKKLQFILLVILATLFHLSAAAFITVFFVNKIHINKKNIVLWGGATIFLFVLFNSILDIVLSYRTSYNTYVKNGKYFGSGYLALFLNIVLWVIFVLAIYVLYRNGKLVYPNTVDHKFKNIKTMYWEKVCLFALMMITVYICGFKLNLMDRVAGYFRCAMIILIPNALGEIKLENTKKCMELYVVLLMLLFFFSQLILRPEWTGIYPYHFSFY